MYKRPLILLDIDGVINASGRKEKYWKDAKSIKDFLCVDSEGEDVIYNIFYSPTVVERIKRWEKHAEIKWLTSWNDRANKYLAPAIGLPLFDNARADSNTSKLNAVLAHIHEHPDRLIIWIDDQLPSAQKKHKHNEMYQKLIFTRTNTVFVSPTNGLIGEHIDFIEHVLRNPLLVRGCVLKKDSEGEHRESRHGCVIC
jgi:hypothetical protein